MFTFRNFLVEKIVGNTGWVYHRTKNNPEESDIITQGIKPSTNQSAMYGKGLYCCYDLDQQLKPNMEKYGEYILKGKIDLNGFAILDEDIYQLANPKGIFESHLKKIGTSLMEVKDRSITPYTSRIAQRIWQNCKRNGYNGIIFTGESDGKVAVIWNRRNFIPYQYSGDNGAMWKRLNPDIASIKRSHDPVYDEDKETVKHRDMFKGFYDKEEIGDLNAPSDYKGPIILKKVKKSKNIYARNARKIELPLLQDSGLIDVEYTSELILPELEISSHIRANRITEIEMPNLLICGDMDFTMLKKFDFPKLKRCLTINAATAEEIDLPVLERCFNIYTNMVKRLILPNLKLSKHIFAASANEVDLSKLEQSDVIKLDNIAELNLPQLHDCYKVEASEAIKLNLPKLEDCVGINASIATEMFIPKLLNGRGDIFAPRLKKIIVSSDFKIKITDTIPEDCEIIYAENTPQIKVDENVTFKKYLMLKESLVQIPLDSAYEIFKNEYDKSTGTSWTYDKFMGRARNWEFYGDEKGYVAIRRQRSGLVKLVGMAGDNRSKLKGINDLISMNMPLWGMVSKDIKDIAVRRGMREPNFLERQVLKRSIPPEVLGGAEILEYQKDGGIKLQYPDVGVVVKYLVGTPEYYAKLRTMLGDKVKEKILG